jgi:drug/metabolite transporter (DMT)-like permease
VPVVTALLAYLLFGEKLDAMALTGMVICAAGVFIVNRSAARSRLAAAAAD